MTWQIDAHVWLINSISDGQRCKHIWRTIEYHAIL